MNPGLEGWDRQIDLDHVKPGLIMRLTYVNVWAPPA
jgi:hypothetical protein